tara:strand:- start:1546 stop:1827 length:282 start_codon:yes stop_codon:yes gene_type:complete
MPDTIDEAAFDLLYEADECLYFDPETVERIDDKIVARGYNSETNTEEKRTYEVDEQPIVRDHWNPWTETHYTTDVPNIEITLLSAAPLPEPTQ